MTHYFSPSTSGFYSDAIHDQLPEDAVEISGDQYAELLNGVQNGQLIGLDADGEPKNFDRPAPTAEQVLATNTAQRTTMMQSAAQAIAPLQDAADLGIASASEQSSLAAWKQYRVSLSRVDLTQPHPAWPTAPQT
jgi:hypothetical protein